MIFDEDIKESLSALKRGGIILYPTDTIWGLGCDATNSSAVDRIFRIKSRADSKSLVILVSSESMLERYTTDIPGIAYELATVSESPLTIIYPGGRNLAPGVCSEDGSVGIRICREEFCNELITRFRKPVVSTSANLSGKPSPMHYDEIDRVILDSVDYVVRYRQDDHHKYRPSPVIKVGRDSTVTIIRK
jgi:L-threonylcarbamoyladenylate synthase